MWMWQLLLCEIRRSLPCVVFKTSTNAELNKRFLPFLESICVSVIANDRSGSSLMSTKLVCILSYQLIKIRLAFLVLKKEKRWIDLDFKFKEVKELYRKTSYAGLSCSRNILPRLEKEFFFFSIKKLWSIQSIPTSRSCIYPMCPYFLPPQLELLSPYQPFKSTLYENTTEREINLVGNFVIIYAGVRTQYL